ncbi:MAG: hypothetical protein K6E59_01165 [Bacilli bacterium]|nr:hypothetical protein [Bacilli bacterium]
MIAILATHPDDLLYIQARLTFLSGERELKEGVKTIHGFFGEEEVVLLATGPSGYLGALYADLVINRYDPDVVYCVGDCFALSPLVKEGDIVIGTKCFLHGVNYHAIGEEYGAIPGLPAALPCSASLGSTALSLAGSSGLRAFAGGILSGEKAIFDKDEFDEILLRRYAGKDLYAYDNSSAGAALSCYLHRKSFLPIRVVSLVPGMEEGRLRYRRIALEALPGVGRIIFGLCSSHQSKKGGA